MTSSVTRKILDGLLLGKRNLSKSGLERSRIRFLNGLAIVSIVIFLIYIVINAMVGDYGDLIMELGLIVVLVIAMLVIRRPGGVSTAIFLGSLVVTFITVHNFGSGGFGSTGLLWAFMFPPIIFILQGYKKGLIWLGILFGIFIVTIALQPLPYLIYPYPSFTILMLLISLFTVAMLTLFYQYIQEKNQGLIKEQADRLIKSNTALQKEIEKRQKMLKETKEQAEATEKVNQLMVGRELKMVELKNEIEVLKKKASEN